MRNKIILMVGPSGSGKTAVADAMEKLYYLKGVESYTTRPPRSDKEKGHIFVSDEEFKKISSIIAPTFYNGYYYGATSEQLDRADLYVIDPVGVEFFREHYTGNKTPVVVYIDVPEEVYRERMKERGDSEDAIETRLATDRVAFTGVKKAADIVVANGRDKTISDLACEIFNKVGFAPIKNTDDRQENLTQTELRIIGALKNIEKTEKTLERHRKTLEKRKKKCLDLGFDPEADGAVDKARELSSGANHDAYWAYYDYTDSVDAIKSNLKKIAEYTEKLGEYREKKAVEDKKNAVPLVPSVEEFLSRWKTDAAGWIRGQVISLKTFIDEIEDKRKAISAKYEPRTWEHRKEIAAEEQEARVDYQSERKRIATNFTADVRDMYNYRGLGFEERLEKVLSDEVRRKRIDLFARCSAVVGVITDASHLYVGDDLNLNGFVVGEKGKANVRTIGAGGYAVQCFHYRVLVQPEREKTALDDVIADAKKQGVNQHFEEKVTKRSVERE